MSDITPHPQLTPVLGLLGHWHGRGSGEYPSLDDDFTYEQEVTFSHDGRPFLHYEARSWIVDAEGAVVRQAARESGWWRVQPEGRIEALITQPTGIAEVMTGHVADGTTELASHTVALAPTAKQVDASRRTYVLDGDTLTFTHAMAAVGHPMQHHLSAHLLRK